MADQAVHAAQSVYPLPPGEYQDSGYKYENEEASRPDSGTGSQPGAASYQHQQHQQHQNQNQHPHQHHVQQQTYQQHHQQQQPQQQSQHQQSPQQPSYPQPQQSAPPPTAPPQSQSSTLSLNQAQAQQPVYSDPSQAAHQHQNVLYAESQQDGQTQSTPSSATKQKEVKPRLRKACDSCSVRKVKCDESGPPCKSCAALDIPCTFNRPSRRRGPPNRHAEAIKRQRLDDGTYNPMPTTANAASPTRDAAYGLAALSAPMQQQQLSAEMICDVDTLQILVDDYFTYIHPLIPVPHEPTFRDQFKRREDTHDRSFLALLAGMIEILVASFPRRVKQIFSSPEGRALFPNASALVSRCHFVFTEARGKGFMDREDLNLYDACGSYMVGLAFAYMFDLRKWRLYCSECVTLLRVQNHQKAEEMHTPGSAFEQHGNLIDQQVGRRLFWLCFVGSMTMRQLGSSDSDIIMPHAHSDALPPMPVEIDDQYITPTQYLGQPAGELSTLVGFSTNIKIYRAFHAMTAIEMAVGSDVLFDWDRQRSSIRNAIRNVKEITKDVPPELRLEQNQDFGEWPPRSSETGQYTHLLNGRRDPNADAVGLLNARDPRRTSPYPRKTVAYEMQKANIYGTQLATRSYLVERYWNLYALHEQQKSNNSNNPTVSPKPSFADNRPQSQSQGSPTVAFLASGFENRFQPPRSHRTPSESTGVDEGEQQMAIEREDIVRDMAKLLKSVNQVNMEPNGHSFCHKLRQVASTLLSQDRSLMSRMPTLDSTEVEQYLRTFIDILTKLERIGTTLMTGNDPSYSPPQNGEQMPQGQPLSGVGMYAQKTQEEIEEEELLQWASLKEHQERFVLNNQGYLGL